MEGAPPPKHIHLIWFFLVILNVANHFLQLFIFPLKWSGLQEHWVQRLPWSARFCSYFRTTMYDTDISMNAWPDSTQWVSFLVKIFCSLLRSRSRQYYKYRYGNLLSVPFSLASLWFTIFIIEGWSNGPCLRPVKVVQEKMVVEGGKKSWVFFGFST